MFWLWLLYALCVLVVLAFVVDAIWVAFLAYRMVLYLIGRRERLDPFYGSYDLL